MVNTLYMIGVFSLSEKTLIKIQTVKLIFLALHSSPQRILNVQILFQCQSNENIYIALYDDIAQSDVTDCINLDHYHLYTSLLLSVYHYMESL